VENLAAALLEALGPLATLVAQLVYLGQPLLSWGSTDRHLAELAHMLEDSTETREFVDYLREIS
jgi:hypothetical protein